jgi:uncharacterized membrane protein YgaE (UPF0421/DUF939 family)
LHIGARILKTGIAAVLAIYIGRWLGLTPVTLSAIAAVIAIQPSVYRSWTYALEQTLGNAIGAVYAIGAVTILGSEPLSIGIVIVATILTNIWLKLDRTIVLSMVTVIAIMEFQQGNYYVFAENRFMLTMIGILSATLLNTLFYPPKYEHHFVEQARNVSVSLQLLLKQLIHRTLILKEYSLLKEEAKQEIEKMKEMVELLKEQRKHKRTRNLFHLRRLVVMIKIVELLKWEMRILEWTECVEVPKETELLEQYLTQREQLLLHFEGKIHYKAPKYGDKALTYHPYLVLIRQMNQLHRYIDLMNKNKIRKKRL